MKRLTFPLADNYLWAMTICVLMVLAVVASCLNPIAFNPGDVSIKVEGEIEIKDKAVLWVINKTKTVSVTNLTITREDNPSEVYPQIFTGTFEKGVPGHGESFGTYHWPNASFFNVLVSYTNEDGSETGSKTIRMQMLRAQDYIIWVYRGMDGEINIEENLPTMPEDPNDREDPPNPPQSDKEFPVVIRNVTQNRNITRLEFAHSNSGMRVVMENEGPHARDQRAVFLAAGEWIVTAHYNIAGGGTGSSAERHILIDSRTFQAGKHGTLLLYFYASKSADNDTDFTQWWPPIPNDVKDNDNDTIYTGNQGALQVANKSETGSFIVDIMIDNVLRYDGGINGNVYKDDTTAPPFILSAGLHQIKFRTNKTAGGFGPAHPVLITAGQLRTLSFYDALSDLDTLPPDDGHGSGLIKIINKSKLPAYEIRIAKATNTATQMVIGSNQFQPSGPVNGDGSSGYVDVVGTAAFPVENDYYVIYVILKNTSGDKTIQRIAYLKDRVVEIIIEEKDIPVDPNIPAIIGATIKVKNEVQSTISDSGRTLPLEVLITTVTPYNISTNQGYPYSTTTWTPSGFISNNQMAQFMVYDSPQMPITQTATFTSTVLAIVSVGSGDNIRTGYAMVTVPLSPDGSLYSTTPPSHTREIKLTYDLVKHVVDPLIPPVNPDPGTDPGTDPNPQFIPVVNVELQSATISKDTDTSVGPYNQLNWTVFPLDATNQSGAWTAGDLAVLDSSYKVLENGGVWVSSSYTKTYLNIAIVIPNGIALGDRRPSLEIVTTEGQIGFLRFDATKDYVKTFKLAFGTTPPQPPQGTGTYNVKIIRDGQGSQTGTINYLVFRPHTGMTLSYSSYSSQDSGFVCAGAITLPTTWSPPGNAGDIYFDVSSVKPKNLNSKEVKIPDGQYQIFEVIGTTPLGYSVNYAAPFNTTWTEYSGTQRGAHVIISAEPYFKPSGIPNGYRYPVHVLYGTMPAHD